MDSALFLCCLTVRLLEGCGEGFEQLRVEGKQPMRRHEEQRVLVDDRDRGVIKLVAACVQKDD